MYADAQYFDVPLYIHDYLIPISHWSSVMLKQFRTRVASTRLREEAIYAEVLREIESGTRRDGLYAKAIAECNGDIASANAAYIRLRVQSIRDEIEIASGLASEEKQAAQQQQVKREKITAAQDERRLAERKASIEKTTSQHFLAYDQPLIVRALRKSFAVSAFVCAFFTVGLLLQLLVGNKIDGRYLALFAVAAVAALIGFVKCSPTHAFVVCPMCRTRNRVPAHSSMNCRCGECRHEFEIKT